MAFNIQYGTIEKQKAQQKAQIDKYSKEFATH